MYNILDLARTVQAVADLGIEYSPISDDKNISLMSLATMDAETIVKLCRLVFPNLTDIEDAELMNKALQFFMTISDEISRYTIEIAKREAHAIEIGCYVKDSEEEVAKKAEKYLNLYPGNNYMAGYLTLCKNNVCYKDLSIFEALIAIESLMCDEINSGSMQLIGMIASEEPHKSEQYKKIVRHANFVAFALDIYDTLDNDWQRIVDNKDKK